MRAERPRILLDALLVTSRPTGVGRSILELVRALAAQDRGLDFTVLASEARPFAFLDRVPGWDLELCPGAAGGSLRKAVFTQASLGGVCRRLGADILHSLQFVAPLRLPCPSVVTVHDLAWKVVPGILQPARAAYYDLMVPPSLGRARLIAVNSESTAAEVARIYPATAARIRLTPFATPGWAAERLDRSQAPAAAGTPYFLFAGTFEPRKNLVNILRAFDLFLARCAREDRPDDPIPDLLLVGGKGWRDGPIRREIGRLASTGKVRTQGFLQPAQLWDLYRGARALVFPSLHEGFGFPILEAMAAGCPVLTSARGAMLEVGGEGARFCDPDDPASIAAGMWDLDRDLALRERLISAGFLLAESRTWAATAAATTAVYREVLAADQAAAGP